MSTIRRYTVIQTREVRVTVDGDTTDAAILAEVAFRTPMNESIREINVGDKNASVTRVNETSLEVRLED
jgi:hypothetical protein